MNAYDIIIIGAGIAGASAAAELARTRKVLLLEQEPQPGHHSTGRSAASFSETYGPEQVRALSRASRDFLFDPPEGFCDAPLVQPRGELFVATAAQMPALETFMAQADIAAAGEPVDRLAALELCPILRPDYVAGGFLERHSRDVDVHALHQGFLRRFKARGGELRVDAGVTGLERTSQTWRVHVGDQGLVAPVVVNAAGAWADRIAGLAGAEPIGLQPLRRTAALVSPPDGVSVRDWPMVIDIDEQFYFKPDAGRILISPADETPSEPCDAQADEWDVAVAVDRVERATTLQVRRVAHRWAGLRTFAPDGVPVVGWDPAVPGFFWLAGQGGYGIQTAPALAVLTADLIEAQTASDALLGHGVRPEELSPARMR